MTKQNGDCFASAYHNLVRDLSNGLINKAIYDMLYISLNAVYDEELGRVDG